MRTEMNERRRHVLHGSGRDGRNWLGEKTEHFMQFAANKSSPKEMNMNEMNSSGNATYCFFKHVIGQMLLALTLRVIFRSPSNHTCTTLHPQNKF